MPLSLLLEIPSPSAAWADRPGALRALAYALVNAGDLLLAQELHDAAGGGERPFTIAVLPEERESTVVRVRLTALDEPTGSALRAGTARLLEGEGNVTFGRDAVRLAGCHWDLPPLAETQDYAALTRTPFSPFAALRFVTPLTFSQGGERHLPLPVPDLLLRGWARRWNRFAPPELALPEQILSGLVERTGLAHVQGETVTVVLRPGKVVGFVGAVTLEALHLRAWPAEQRQAFATLTTFSRFCGSGARTTQGMGLTLPENREGLEHEKAGLPVCRSRAGQRV